MNDLKKESVCLEDREGEYLEQKTILFLVISDDEGVGVVVSSLFTINEYPQPLEGVEVVASAAYVLLLVSQPVVGGRWSPELRSPAGQLCHGGGDVAGGQPDVLDPRASVVPQELVDVTVLVPGERLGKDQFEVPDVVLTLGPGDSLLPTQPLRDPTAHSELHPHVLYDGALARLLLLGDEEALHAAGDSVPVQNVSALSHLAYEGHWTQSSQYKPVMSLQYLPWSTCVSRSPPSQTSTLSLSSTALKPGRKSPLYLCVLTRLWVTL